MHILDSDLTHQVPLMLLYDLTTYIKHKAGAVVQTSLSQSSSWTMPVYRTGYRNYSDLWTIVQDDVDYEEMQD
jgi:hypothetical protein